MPILWPLPTPQAPPGPWVPEATLQAQTLSGDTEAPLFPHALHKQFLRFNRHQGWSGYLPRNRRPVPDFLQRATSLSDGNPAPGISQARVCHVSWGYKCVCLLIPEPPPHLVHLIPLGSPSPGEPVVHVILPPQLLAMDQRRNYSGN